MYIQQSVIDKYIKLVKKEKTQNTTEREILFRINADLDLGKKVYTFSNGDYLIQYFDLVFKCSGFRCVSLYRDIYNKPYIVPTDTKKRYIEEIESEVA